MRLGWFPKRQQPRTAGSRVHAHVGAGPSMGERGRMRAEGRALTSPGSVALQLPGPGEGGISFGGPPEGIKRKAFVGPGLSLPHC